ncbi:GumC family protein [Simiduia agarivorans]|uniref:Lipopolysaccharide biosynthesis protein n=1 Tax=Simiduia agarivorans (strain DSM 21679 / JCM 13881 / BCRC 17597 / SA1) TaxID=1117647 RepID=K4KKX4_SIMAS|nr:hypothetical protein [Simiduia agarivorans]AFU99804.1 hypothetical protein M5M_13300 [Simiduia agarivorans SA1 = DSM 21679]
MNNFPVIYEPKPERVPFWRRRPHRYVWVALVGYGALIAILMLYMSRTPIYDSAHALVLPGSGSSSNFNIDEVGTANQDTRTPFGSVEVSPLANYREIIKSRNVLLRAADLLRVHPTLLDMPRVELRERTSIMMVHTEGLSGERAQEIGWAFYEAFQAELERLRKDEVARRDDGVQQALAGYRAELERTRQAIVEFQQRSLLVSEDQMTQLMVTLSSVKEQQLTLASSARNTEDFVRQLSLDLGISPSLAGQAFALQSDAAFRGYLKELDASAMLLAEYSSRWGEQHPKVVAQSRRYDKALSSLKVRSVALVGAQVSDALQTTDLQASPERAQLFATLVDSFAKLQGIEAERQEMVRAEMTLTDRLKIYSREAAELERLQRDHSLAEAVYTSAAARLQAGKADIFASYPAVQLLSVPSMPEKPKNPSVKIAAAIGVLGFLFITFALLTLWHRSRLIALILKNS